MEKRRRSCFMKNFGKITKLTAVAAVLIGGSGCGALTPLNAPVPAVEHGNVVEQAGAEEGRASATFGDVLFEFDKADVKKESMPYVKPLIAFLKEHPKQKVRIEGHTDNVGTGVYNLDLSTKRAEAVRDVLVKAGVNSQRIASAGIGEAKPIASNDTAEGRTMNRRVEVDVF
jgi:outer membrane protein OmpA-like peptidoglycan-associated protein